MSAEEKIREKIRTHLMTICDREFNVERVNMEVEVIMQIIEPEELEAYDIMEGEYMSDEELKKYSESYKESIFGLMKGASND